MNQDPTLKPARPNPPPLPPLISPSSPSLLSPWKPQETHLTPPKRNDIGGVELLLLDEPDPPFGQDVALAAVPVRVTEPSWLPVTILEVQEESLVTAGRSRRKYFHVLLWNHQLV
ncbi:hypothetical protein RHGRI_007806 [Rhododendron griersonianum]|uniref:Uncharacterized protein n=1 Tax=Rhododendron griersonianum TaxID=479676 RepID=A0AAV6L013_9ERIC|nr:hypothetical protein RHGRI_007806 [Rhododendron griersonianum]